MAENETPEWQPNEDYYEYLKAAQEPLNEEDVFLKTYGFPHDCRCAEDYLEGNVGMVSACWGQMCDDALAACASFKEENESLKLAMGELRAQVTGAGLTPIA